MEQLVEAYHNVAASPELRELIRQRERAKHNEASALANAEQKGRAKGRAEGLAEGLAEGRAEAQQDFVRTMYHGGFSIAEIVRATGLSEQDVNGILGM